MTRHIRKNYKNEKEIFVVFMESLPQNYIFSHVLVPFTFRIFFMLQSLAVTILDRTLIIL